MLKLLLFRISNSLIKEILHVLLHTSLRKTNSEERKNMTIKHIQILKLRSTILETSHSHQNTILYALKAF